MSVADNNGPPVGATDYTAMRKAMVSSQLRTSAVNDPRVVAAMAVVPRERFVPAAMRATAYRDASLSLDGVGGGAGRRLNLPMATGRLLTEAYLRPSDRVLLIGAATGYAAAVLAELVTDVVAVEADAGLAAFARDALRGVGSGAAGVTLVEGPLEAGAPDRGPYDVLVVDGAVEAIPPALAAQLRPDGRAVSGLADRGVTRLAAGRRAGDGLSLQPFADVECAGLPGFARPRAFAF